MGAGAPMAVGKLLMAVGELLMAVGKPPMEVGVITAMAGLIRSHRIGSPSYLGRGFQFGDRLWPREGSAQPVVLNGVLADQRIGS